MAKNIFKNLRWLLFNLGLAILTVSVTYGIIISVFGSTSKLVASIQGRSILLEPSTLFLGQVVADETRLIEYEVVNLSSRPVNITKITTSCSCTATETKLPAAIGPSERLRLRFNFHAPSEKRSFSETIEFFSDGEPRQFYGRIVGEAVVSTPSKVVVK